MKKERKKERKKEIKKERNREAFRKKESFVAKERAFEKSRNNKHDKDRPNL